MRLFVFVVSVLISVVVITIKFIFVCLLICLGGLCHARFLAYSARVEPCNRDAI